MYFEFIAIQDSLSQPNIFEIQTWEIICAATHFKKIIELKTKKQKELIDFLGH